MRASVALLLIAASCSGDEWPSVEGPAVLVRVELDDPSVAWVSYRVWDERYDLVRDELLPASDFPRIIALVPGDDDPTDTRYRGGLLEIETWTEELCPRERESIGFRYDVTPRQTEVQIAAPTTSYACTAFFVTDDGSGDVCSQEAPCALDEAMRAADAVEGRFVIHLAGGTYTELDSQRRFQKPEAPVQNVIRAWPGRSLPEPPTFISQDPRSCDPADEMACNRNSICVDSRCAPETPINLCCAFNDSAPSQLELDGFRTRRGKFGVEVNGGTNITIRHFQIEDAGGASLQVPSAGMRVFVTPNTIVEHNRVRRSVDLTSRSPFPAVGILIDGINRERDEVSAIVLNNRIEQTQGPAFQVSMPDGRVQFEGNGVCEAGVGLELPRGNSPVEMLHDAFLTSGMRGIDAESFEGTITVRRATFSPDAPSTSGAVDVSESILFETGDAATNQVDGDAPDVTDCLVGTIDPAFGVCASFPFCETP